MNAKNHIEKTAEKSANRVKFPHSNTGVIFTCKSSVLPINKGVPKDLRVVSKNRPQKNYKNLLKFSISLDYLQLSCKGTFKDFNETAKNINGFEIIKVATSTRVFRSVYIVYDSYGNRVGQFLAHPHSNIIPADTILFKVQNEVLYYDDCIPFVCDMLDTLCFRFSAISRIDICADFNRFKNNLDPQNFIRGFFKQKYLKNGRSKFYSIGSSNPNSLDFQYLRFGKTNASYSCYIYNKSLEMKEVLMKKHIREFWKLNNINDSQTVWRLEVSIKGSKNTLIDTDTGEMEAIELHHLNDLEYLKLVYFSYIKKGFSFKINDGTKNKTRMKDVELFHKHNFSSILPKRIISNPNALRTKKLVLKNLMRERNKLIDIQHDGHKQMMRNTAVKYEDIIAQYVRQYGLAEYYKYLEENLTLENFKI